MAEQLSMIAAAAEPGPALAGIAALLIRFSNAVDRKQPDDVADTFSPEGLFRGPGEQEIRGRAAIQSFYLGRMSDPRRRTRHVWSNLFVRPISPKQAQFEVVLTNYAFEPATAQAAVQMRIGNVAGQCESDESGTWRFTEHLYERLFATSLPLAGGIPNPVGA